MAMHKKTKPNTRAKVARAPKPTKPDDGKIFVERDAIRGAMKHFVKFQKWNEAFTGLMQTLRKSFSFPESFNKEQVAAVDLLLEGLQIHLEAIDSHRSQLAYGCGKHINHIALVREVEEECEQARLRHVAHKEHARQEQAFEDILYDIYSSDGTRRILQ